MHPPVDVLKRYSTPPGSVAHYLGARGGFSGARVWRLETASGSFCLKAWPSEGMTAPRLTAIHGLVRDARAGGLDFLPHIVPARAGSTVLVSEERLWDLSTWMPGSADFHAHPSSERVRSACSALARLHRTWQRHESRQAPCPGVRRRLDALETWGRLRVAGWQPGFAEADPMHPWAERAWRALEGTRQAAFDTLLAWRDIALPIHACWCDPWHDHVLFTGERLTGLIDYGSVKGDHAAVDLARLLGSLVGDDLAQWDVGFAAYHAVRPLTERERALARVLERTGLVVAAMNWLRWLYHERRVYENAAAVAKRLQNLVQRLDNQALLGLSNGSP